MEKLHIIKGHPYYIYHWKYVSTIKTAILDILIPVHPDPMSNDMKIQWQWCWRWWGRRCGRFRMRRIRADAGWPILIDSLVPGRHFSLLISTSDFFISNLPFRAAPFNTSTPAYALRFFWSVLGSGWEGFEREGQGLIPRFQDCSFFRSILGRGWEGFEREGRGFYSKMTWKRLQWLEAMENRERRTNC